MAIPHDGRTVYFCIDIEASGQIPGFFNMVSIGAVEVRFEVDRHVRKDTWYAEIVPDYDGFSPSAMAIHKLTEAHLRENGRPPKEVMAELADWVRDHLRPREKALFVGHNAPFDWMYVSYYFEAAGVENIFGYNALDTKALMMGRHQFQWRQCNKSRLVRLYPELEAPAEHMVHNALADAEFQADILIALLDDP